MKICQTCDGKGQTRECATIVKQVKPKVWQTTQLGSGCLVCLGLGIIGKRHVWAVQSALPYDPVVIASILREN